MNLRNTKNSPTRFSRLYHQVDLDEPNEALERLLIKRAMLLNRAENKLVKLAELLAGKTESLHHALFYCAPGRIASVMELLTDLGLRIAKFTAEESTDKKTRTLRYVCVWTPSSTCRNEMSG